MNNLFKFTGNAGSSSDSKQGYMELTIQLYISLKSYILNKDNMHKTTESIAVKKERSKATYMDAISQEVCSLTQYKQLQFSQGDQYLGNSSAMFHFTVVHSITATYPSKSIQVNRFRTVYLWLGLHRKYLQKGTLLCPSLHHHQEHRPLRKEELQL